ncbi:MAG: extracellular solute-binding protein [Paenibacillus sp.]|jgi:multiple sugar transport system substrate-binding protein|nr:extracellular solute-binding protein [Paenibacillus sp.]
MTKLKRTVSRSNLELLIDTIRTEILTGVRKAGEFLPSELALCEQYSLSNFTVRKGLDVLVAEGLIEKVPRIGTRVLPSGADESASPVTIRLGYYATMRNSMHVFELVDAFMSRNPHIHIQPVEMRIPYMLNKNEVALLMESYDVLMMNYSHFERLMNVASEDGLVLEPIEPVEGVYPFLQRQFARGDKQFAQPIVYSPIVMCYNKEHFRDMQVAEPDSGWTWDDAMEAAHKLSDGKERYGLYFHVTSDNRWPIFLLQNGFEFVRNEHGKYDFRNPRFIESMQKLMELIGQGTFPPVLLNDERDEYAMLLNQKVSMVLTTYDRLQMFRDAPFAYDIAPVPYFREPRTLLHVIALGVNAKSKHKQAAQSFIRYMMEIEQQRAIRKHTMRIPALRQAAVEEWGDDDPFPNRPAHYDMYRDIIPTFRYYTDLNMSHADLTVVCDEMKYYWSGLDDLETVLRRLEEKL